LPDAEITGLDLSDALVAAAQARVDGRANVRFVAGNAASWTPADGAPFDLIVSRHGVMFFEDPVAAFSHLHGLAPQGRLLFSCFRAAAENEWMSAMLGIIERHAPDTLAAPPPAVGPFAFAEPARIEEILAGAGFAPPVIKPFDFTFLAGADGAPVADAMAYFRRIGPMARLAASLDEGAREAFLADLAGVAGAHCSEEGVAFRAAAWIVSSQA
jgi:SAM-dependent methyltransferase